MTATLDLSEDGQAARGAIWPVEWHVSFSMAESTKPNGQLVLMIAGELDLAVCERLDARLKQLAGARTAVVIDLSDLSFIDSSGLQVLIDNVLRARQDGWKFSLEPDMPRSVRRVIEITGTERLFWPAAESLDRVDPRVT